MPTYEYACRDCEERLEVVQSFSDDPLTVCPQCGGQLRKVFSAAGIIFKGSGYYVTDSRKAETKANGAGSKESSGTSSGESAASESQGSGGEGSKGSSEKAAPTSTGTSTADD